MDDPTTVSPLALRVWGNLEQFRRDADVALAYPLLTYFGCLCDPVSNVDALIGRFNFIPPDEGGPPDATSDLIDPGTGDPEWLPWQALLYGARLDRTQDVDDQRAQIATQRNGPSRGSKPSIVAAAQTVLSGSKTATVIPLADGPWTIHVQVIDAELPAGGTDAVLAAILDADVKPAGYRLTVVTYTSSWDTQEADFPTWNTRGAASWSAVQAAT